MAEFDGEEYTPWLPAQWAKQIFEAEKPELVFETTIPQPEGAERLMKHLPAFVNLSSCLSKIGEALGSMRSEVSRLDLTDSSHRAYARAILDNLTTAQGKDRRTLGEYSTPENIREFMVCLADPKSGESVYDPCCGTGGLLRKALDYVQRESANASQGEINISGSEISIGPYIIAICNAVLSGANNIDIGCEDSLNPNGLGPKDGEKYDCILAVPPFGHKPTEPETILGITVRGIECRMILNILKKLKPGGRAVVCMPHGFSFAAGEQRKIRKLLCDEYCLESIGALPGGAFSPFTNIKADIYLIRNSKPETVNHQSVSFDDLPKHVFDNREVIKKTPAQKQANLKFIREWVAEEYRQAHNFGVKPFPLSTIRENEYDLSKRDPFTGEWFNEIFLRDYENDDSVDVLPLVSLAELNQGVQNRKEHMAIYVDLPEEEILEQTIHPTLLKIGDVDSENQKIKSSVQQLKPAAVEKFSSKSLKPDDVLFSCGGTIGKTFLMTNDYYKEYKEGALPGLRLDTN